MNLDFLDKGGLKKLGVGECLEIKAKMKGESFKMLSCRVSENKWKMESPQMDMKWEMTKKDIEDVKSF